MLSAVNMDSFTAKSGAVLSETDSRGLEPKSAYIHIPFCRRRCYYCDFPVSVVGDRLRGENSGTIRQYIEVLCEEIAAAPPAKTKLDTIFFGGGTPSLLSVDQLRCLLEALERRFGIAEGAEISMEMDPGTFGLEHLQGYRQAGVNRVSLGVQAFQTELLQACGRTHTVADIEGAVALLRQVNLPSFSLDLISGLPTQGIADWQDSLERAIALQPNHLSIYDLTIEPQTAFGRWYEPGAQPLPSDELTANMYRLAQRTLTAAGYEHYEISNYAKPGCQCRHNRTYWKNRPFYGFGMGAASYVQGQRFSRPRKTPEYKQWVKQFVAAGGQINCPITSLAEKLLDQFMVGLRLAEGLDLRELAKEFGEDILARLERCLTPYIQKGWVTVVEVEGKCDRVNKADLKSAPIETQLKSGEGSLKLTDPEGFLYSNVVLVTLFEEFSD
ncbi:MAG: radical SAM family heme chaperone HemW [Leptolyngbyaceae cyanobacterium MO_188.B28]|nr:radical SAM family heme chaperone HemW [Leptolyngbyaceae cyanobacterium MO_188.B28]